MIALHTMQRSPPHLTRYPVAGSNLVDKVRYAEPSGAAGGRVYVNAEQYFDGVPPAVWESHIGGYRVAEKWLKDRKGRALSYDDLTTTRTSSPPWRAHWSCKRASTRLSLSLVVGLIVKRIHAARG